MAKLSASEIKTLEEIAQSSQPWADAVAAYLSALKEMGEI